MTDLTELLIERYCYADTETEGRLYLPEDEDDDEHDYLYTLERPWLEGPEGGLPFESCIPDGTYELIPHTRPKNRGDVYALRNPALGVYYTKQDRGQREGRYLILIHSANKVSQVVGCIAPGLVRTIAENLRQVRSSRLALERIMAHKRTTLTINGDCGTG